MADAAAIKPLSVRGNAALVAGYVIAYVALDWVSHIHPVANLNITAWNPPPGVSLALLFAYGLRYAPALFVAALTADLVVRGGTGTLAESAFFAAILACGYTTVAYVLLRWLKVDPLVQSMRDLTIFTVGTTLAVVVVALCFVGSHAWLGFLDWSEVPDTALKFWVGDVIGILVTTPFLMVFGPRLAAGALPRATWEAGLPAIAIALAIWVVFGIDESDKSKFFYVLFLPLIWVSMWHGFSGATAGLMVIQIGLILAITASGFTAATMLDFQLLMIALAVTGLYLGLAATERQRSQEALRDRERVLERSLRVASAAETASALAHELNQPLSAVSNYVRAAKLLAAQPQDNREQFKTILDETIAEVTRAVEVVRRLREFYRSGSTQLERMDIGSLIDEALEPLRLRIKQAAVSLAVQVAPGLPPVSVDRVHMAIVLHNLVANAVDAIANSNATERRIEVVAMPERGENARYIRLAVSDTGPGIAEELEQRMFQPFSSTKTHGMGLGLAVSRSIVENHGGQLWIERSRPGASFCLRLPVATNEEDEA